MKPCANCQKLTNHQYSIIKGPLTNLCSADCFNDFHAYLLNPRRSPLRDQTKDCGTISMETLTGGVPSLNNWYNNMDTEIDMINEQEKKQKLCPHEDGHTFKTDTDYGVTCHTCGHVIWSKPRIKRK